MYEAYFNFTGRPFVSIAQTEQYFAGTAIENARQRLIRCIDRAEGIGMAVGPSGTGKTLLCQMLKEHFCDKYDVVLLCSGRLSTRKALFQAILYELGRPYRQMDEGELRIALSDYLLSDGLLGDGVKSGSLVLLVDEAQNLPLRLLEEVRMLTNLVNQSGPRIRLVLCGGSILEERFASPRLESFSQRIVARCYLEPFNRAETQQYLRERIDAVGGNGESFFNAETAQAVYQATDGVPRLINQVCDHALLMAYCAARKLLRARDIEEAWADLQQLPTPWSDEDAGEDGEQSGSENGIVEFGGLDDDLDFPEQTGTPAALADLDSGQEDGGQEDGGQESDGWEDVATVSMAAVDRIEQTLSDLDEDFEPAGSIGPEVELAFGEEDNPFEEEFQEEEVVASRYVANSQTLPLCRDDVIRISDGIEQSHDGSAGVAVARKPQYGQLFAKLRRG
jgi:type II secretory pathway predicted ATPase ExeA